MSEIKEGDIYFVDLSPAIGVELGGIRKCKVIKVYNNNLINVVPFSAVDNRYHYEHTRSIDIKRLREKV